MPAQRVSILIPCFNAAAFLSQALESAMAQTWSNKEVIVVNDGSTDASSDVLRGFEQRGVVVIEQTNKGQSAAANAALKRSTGAYIKFFDADDLMHPELIERQMARLRGATDEVASAEWGRFYDDALDTFTSTKEPVWRDMDSTDWLVTAWSGARAMMQCALWLIPRAVIERSGGWDERLSLINDFEFFARVLCHASQVRFTPGAPLYYRSGIEGSLSRRRSRAAAESAFNSLVRGTGHLLAKRHDADARRACANVLQDFIYTYYPDHADLRRTIAHRIEELGGSDLPPSGPPRFEKLRRFTGWKLARRIQRIAGR